MSAGVAKATHEASRKVAAREVALEGVGHIARQGRGVAFESARKKTVGSNERGLPGDGDGLWVHGDNPVDRALAELLCKQLNGEYRHGPSDSDDPAQEHSDSDGTDDTQHEDPSVADRADEQEPDDQAEPTGAREA